MPEADEAFSDVLNSIADARDARRPDAPRVPERQPDAAARPPKPEADTERQAKRRAPDEAKTEGKTTETPVATPSVIAEDGEEAGEAETSDEAADALLMLGIVQAEPEAPVTAPAADAVTLAAQTGPEAVEVKTPASLAASPVTATEAVETAQAAAPKQGAAFKAERETAVAAENADADAEISLPKISAETLSSLVRPLKASASPDGQAQVQANASNVSNAQPAQAPAPLELLQAAISKHAQLSIGADHHEPAPEGVKPQVSSNAVAPNFAMTAQVNAPVTAQTQSLADATRVPVEQLAVEIATRAGKGERRFDIRLDPPELGRIDVRLEIDGKGNTTAKLIVERAETLDMLQRDARGLEKALQNAGLKTDAGGLQFSLQQDAQTQQGQHNSTPDMRAPARGGQAEAEIITEIATGNAALAAQLRGGVDIRI